MSNTRVPETISNFDIYINITDDCLQAIDPGSGLLNWQRLGLSLANSNDWQSKRVYWRDTLHPAYTSAEKSTTAVKNTVRNFMAAFRKFANPLLVIMAASSAATVQDEFVFRFKRHRNKPSYHTTGIAEDCTASIRHLGGGALRFSVKMPLAEGRPRKPVKADSIQMAYIIGDADAIPDPELMTKEIFTRTIFIFNAGLKNEGKKIHLYFRWFNTKHQHLAGGWSALSATTIV